MTTDSVTNNDVQAHREEVKKTGIKVIVVGAGKHSPGLELLVRREKRH